MGGMASAVCRGSAGASIILRVDRGIRGQAESRGQIKGVGGPGRVHKRD